ncbi:MAG: glycoside hydrolase TIM-barrel-like domain-containing protein [Burkholderiaceae bacterium]|nr:glycoside hydrolase TIM-barrel-like domain-containing protein [Burkholderiaceae bacterium]
MASLVLGVAGAAIGSAVLPAGVTLLGATISGATIGGMIGSTIGSYIDSQLFAQDINQKGPRLLEFNIQESTEGAPIPRLYGRHRVAGQLIWATKFKETVSTKKQGGGKGLGGGGSGTTTEYLYSCSFAVAICEGPIHRIERLWADGNLFDLSSGGDTDGEPIRYRIYYGSEDQPVDPLMEAKEGAGNNPAYRGIAYIVFEDLPLKQFGNRIPQLQFEVIRNLGSDYEDSMERLVKGVCMIPGSGEFIYATDKVTYTSDAQETSSDNKTTVEPRVDFSVSMDQLGVLLPECSTVALVVGWFGTDLRCNQCLIRPGVELRKRDTKPLSWSVAGYSRSSAHLISKTNGRVNYGGTPSDNAVKQAIAGLKSRGYKVILYPFVFMDVPSGNELPNPYSVNASQMGQPIHPWRGRITTSVAPGYAGSSDKTATAGTEVNGFFDNEYIPFIGHYANLAVQAGGVDAILIGSELVGLTTIRSGPGTGPYPAVEKLRSLASTVKGIVGSSCKVGYAANWDEYHSHRPSDGSGDVIFNMDRLWSHSAIDFIGIDNYMPISDWRDGEDHLDFEPSRRIYDKGYLQSNIFGGEYYDWYYASDSDRQNQVRTPIVDGGYGDDWVFRQKDLRNWWSNKHVDRPGGTKGGMLPTDLSHNFTSLVVTDKYIDENGNTRLRIEASCDNTAGASDAEAVLRIIPVPGTPAADGDSVTASFTGKITRSGGAAYEYWAIEQFDASNGYLGGSYVNPPTATNVEGTHSLSHTINAPGTAKTSWAMTVRVSPGTIGSVVFELSVPTLTINGGSNRVADPTFSTADTGSITTPRLETDWTPQSKRIWFTELGCPAIDKGSNQPNVFFDPESSESFVPYFSHGWRDDLIQRAFIEAHMQFWNDSNNNPTSTVYSGRMVSEADILVWCWDARPFPYFPKTAAKWSDADNWTFGHWLNGRAGLVSVDHVIRDLMQRQGFTDYDVSELQGLVAGYKIDQPMSARAAIEPLGGVFFFDGVESDGKIVFRHRDRPSVFSISDSDLIVPNNAGENNSPFELTRGQESELPRSVRVTYTDSAADYRTATAPSKRLTTTSQKDATITAPFVMEQAEAVGLAEATLIETWGKRESAKFVLPPTALGVEPGDIIDVMLANKEWRLRLASVADAHVREVDAHRADRSAYKIHAGPVRSYTGAPQSSDGTLSPPLVGPGGTPNVFGPSALAMMDLPLLTGNEDPAAPHVAAYAKPWTAQLLYRSPSGSGYSLNTSILTPAAMGVLVDPLYSGVTHRWDRANRFRVQMFGDDQLLSADDDFVLDGGNTLFVENANGGWEVLQFANAELVDTRTYELSRLLRGQAGTELEMRDPVDIGARVVLLDAASVLQATLSTNNLNLDFYWRWGPSNYDLSDANYQETVKSFSGVGYRPYSPCHVRGSKDSSDDITINWIRRTRRDGDRWDLPDVPLNEDDERYELDVMDGSTVKRTIDTTTQSAVYTTAMQTDDWGGPVSGPLTVKVYQMSTVFGRGAPRTGVLNF